MMIDGWNSYEFITLLGMTNTVSHDLVDPATSTDLGLTNRGWLRFMGHVEAIQSQDRGQPGGSRLGRWARPFSAAPTAVPRMAFAQMRPETLVWPRQKWWPSRGVPLISNWDEIQWENLWEKDGQKDGKRKKHQVPTCPTWYLKDFGCFGVRICPRTSADVGDVHSKFDLKDGGQQHHHQKTTTN